MRHGIILLPEHSWSRARERWTRAEDLGFDHAWTYDHLMWRWLRDSPWYGAVPILAAAATATSRIRLGTMVAGPSYRHPVVFAKDMMTLDNISDGRLICGTGAGAAGYDDDVLGKPRLSPADRADRFREFVELTDMLLRQPETTYRGKHFTAHEARITPGCVQRPRMPLAIAATGPRGLRLAARHADIWVTAGAPGWGDPLRYDAAFPLLEKQMRVLDQACIDVNRDPSTLRRLVVTGAMIRDVSDSATSYEDATGRFEAIGFTDTVIHWPRPDFPYQGSEQVLEDIAASVLTTAGGS
jgi:alkanesulfonate monooxygenase SsuD/methylene tetrahydromethanopterin reductase-like flavin-dependent oxidoreductase (luciferase family)